MEIWMPIEGYEDSYEISSTGKVRSMDRYTKTWNGQVFKKGVIKKAKPDKDGYFKVWLSKESKKKPFFVHRLLAMHFIPNPHAFPVVNHIDGNKQNNNLSNLEWCTHSHNTKHSFALGLSKPSCGGTSKKVHKLNPSTNEIIATYNSLSEASRENNITVTMISMCANGKCKLGKGFKWVFVDEGVTTIESAS